jgi:molybdenum cofactor cytidylyltransferase
MIWAMILAAGESKRMGKPKMLLPFGNSTILENVMAAAVRSHADRVLVVLGSHRQEIELKIKSLPVVLTYNPQYKNGMLSSIQQGFKTLPPDARAALILLGDQPSVSATVINDMIRIYTETEQGIILPVLKGRRGHPILIDVKYRDEVNRLDPEIGLRELIHRHPGDILKMETNSPDIFQDIDNTRDYQRERKKNPNSLDYS